MSVQHELSSEDFKARIYQSLQGKGILDSMKSQLRHKLATELHVLLGVPSQSSPPARSRGRKSLRTQIADTLVAQYLRSAGYEYSLSTFLPEAGLKLAELISEEEVIEYLRISPSSNVYGEMRAQIEKHGGNCLEGLLQLVMECQGRVGGVAVRDTSVQVCGEEMGEKTHFSSSIAGKLKELEEKYARMSEAEQNRYRVSLDERLGVVQKELEGHYKKQLQTEMELFEVRELARVRQEEQERHVSQLAREREELQRVYHLRLDSVKKSEKNNMEMYRRKEKELEASIFSQRQVLLDELNSLRMKESELKRQAELDKKAIEVERERIKAMSEQMERSLQQLNAQFELVARTKPVKMEGVGPSPRVSWEFPRDMAAMSDVAVYQDKVRMLEEKLSEEKKVTDGVQGRLAEEMSRGEGLRRQLQEVTLQKTALGQAKDEAEVKLAQCADYQQLKADATRLRQQCSEFKAAIGDLESSNKKQQNAIEELRSQLSRRSSTSPDAAGLKKGMAQLQEDHRRQLLVLEYDKKQASKKLQAQVELNDLLQGRLDEQLLQLKAARREVEDLHCLLKAKRTNNSGHVATERKEDAKKGNTSVKSLKSSARSSKPSLQCQPHKFTRELDSFNASSPDISGILQDQTTPTPTRKAVNFLDTHVPFLAESKAAMRRIEKEAEELERTYQDFQLRKGAAASTHSDKHCATLHLDQPPQNSALPSVTGPSLIVGKTTPLDYLKADTYSFSDPPPFHSTARHFPVSDTCHLKFTPPGGEMTRATPSTPDHHLQQHSELPSPLPSLSHHSHTHTRPTPTSHLLLADRTIPTCSEPPGHATSSTVHSLQVSTTSARVTAVATVPSTAPSTVTSPGSAGAVSAINQSSSLFAAIVPSVVGSLPSIPPPSSSFPSVFAQNEATAVSTSSGQRTAPERLNHMPDGEVVVKVASMPAAAGDRAVATSVRTVTAVSDSVVSVSVRDSQGVVKPAASSDARGVSGGSGSLQDWWKSSQQEVGSGGRELATPTTGLIMPLPLTKPLAAATTGPAVDGNSLVTSRTARVAATLPSVPTKATPTSSLPRTSLDSFWKSSQQEASKDTSNIALPSPAGRHGDHSLPAKTSRSLEEDKRNEISSEEEDENSVEEEVSITVTEETVDSSRHELSSVRAAREDANLQPPPKDIEEEVDPVMLKYMKLVQEKKLSVAEQTSKSVVEEVKEKSSSRDNSLGAVLPSDDEDPFEDW